LTVDAGTRRFVRGRAGDRCEYCQLRQEHSTVPHQIEHIVARQHGGSDGIENLALACHRCNLHKGPNLSGVDPMTGGIEVLFHPRRDRWADHFTFRGAYVQGLTPSGRTTVAVLALNDPRRLELREEFLGPDGLI
jgi:hypothetical protein